MANYKLVLLAIIVMLVSCKANEDDMDTAVRKILEPYRSGRIIRNKEQRLANKFYNAVYRDDVKEVKKLLKKGADPNYCLGEAGWADSNPLCVVAESFYNTYYRNRRNERIPNPIPDIAIFDLLLEAGANIDRRPYIWDRVFTYNKSFENLKRQRERSNESTEPVAVREQMEYYVSDANRLIEAFLMAGADPDKLGHPYPFSRDAIRARITDEQANEYFSQGTRAINEAIKKGIFWESQVDILLQYTKLDEDSLIAAEESGDSLMAEKINKLWEEQQAAMK